MNRKDVDINKVTPMMRQYLEIKSKSEDNILFFRLGDFYEMFFEDAILVSHELEITLTGKSAGLNDRIPMCGIPHHSSSGYIEKLIEKGYKVAICEQVEEIGASKGIVKRDIVQIVSSGTVMNSKYLNERDNNYIGNILFFDNYCGICYTDISTGEINVFIIENDFNKIVSEIVRIGILEIVSTSKMPLKLKEILQNNFKILIIILKFKI